MNRIAILALLLLAGCATNQHQEQAEKLRLSNERIAQAGDACKARRMAGEFTRVQSAHCINDAVNKEQANGGFAHFDLVQLVGAHRVALAERVEKGELSEADASVQFAELRARVVAEHRNREMQRANTATYQQQAQSANALGMGALSLQLINAGAPRPASNAMNCTSVRNGVFTNTNCQ